MKHLFIINPAAGGIKEKVAALEQEIRSIGEELGVPFEIFFTKAPMDACNKVKREAQTAEKLYVYSCGGDGTLNECVNGAALLENTAIALYPCGTGNDFLKAFDGVETSDFSDLRALVAGTVRPLDLIDCNGRYGINICSVGIDARVGADVHKYSRIPIIGGATGYVVSLIVNVIKGVGQRFRISTGGPSEERDLTLICACNGRYYGGGFNPAPEADPADGILEILIIKKVSRLKVAQIVGKYAKGRFRELGDIVTYIRGGYVEIESEREFVVNIDGEIVYADKISFKVVPKGVNFIMPNRNYKKNEENSKFTEDERDK